MNPDIKLIKTWIKSPIAFVEAMWGLKPQLLVCQESHEHVLKCYEEFIKGKHLTWQQHKILLAIESAVRKETPGRIAVSSGHGIGKDALLSWIIHWFLFTRYNSQIGCTAPTSDQMYDVLWKELMVWNQRLPKWAKEKFEWTTTHYKVSEAPETWFARARTAKKEAPEAFAGLHGDSVLLLGDEASGIPDEVIKVGEGALTNPDTLVLFVSNPRRLDGFFYDIFHKEKKDWQTLTFDSGESPIVEDDYIDRIKSKYGEDSDEYRFMVLGQFPKEGGIMQGGWMPLLNESELTMVPDVGRYINPFLGVDPAGEGSNKSAFVLRDSFKSKVTGLEEKSNPKSVAQFALTLSTHYSIQPWNITVDNFGVGANVSQEIALATGQRVQAINVGEKADEPERFVNKRSENYWRAREWLLKGGQLVKHPEWKQLLVIYYKRNMSGKIQIMSKEDMSKHGWESPDVADAFSMTFNRQGANAEGRQTRSVEDLSQTELSRIAGLY